MGLRRHLTGGRVGVAALFFIGLLIARPFDNGAGNGPFPWERASLASARLVSSDTLDLAGLQRQFEAVGQRVSGSVVAISAIADPVDADDVLRGEQMNGDGPAALLEGNARTVGTGFVIDAAGHILTNEHVVGAARQLWITTDGGKVYPAVVVGSDPRSDLAVLKVPTDALAPVAFADGSPVRRGQWAIAIGNPYGLAADGELAMSVGVISATDRSLPELGNREDRLYANLIQTTAQIHPGNSGGPLLDLDGRVIGINTAVIPARTPADGIGFALPITSELLASVERLKAGQEIVHGYLGVRVLRATASERRQLNIADGIGVRIDSVEPDSSARRTLRGGDVIVAFDGQTVRDSDHFVRLVGQAGSDHPVRVALYRDGHLQDVEVSVGVRPLPAVAVVRARQRYRWRGMLLGPIPGNWRLADGQRPPAGLLVLSIRLDSPLRAQGVVEGSIISAVAGRPVASVVELRHILNGTPWALWSVRIHGTATTIVSVN